MKQHGLSRPVMRTVATAGLLLGLAFAGAASAQQGTIDPERACKDDAFRLCDQFIPDRDKTGACLRRNARSLSRDCRTVVLGGGVGGHRAVRRTYHHHYHHR
jgi:hypothetical protein